MKHHHVIWLPATDGTFEIRLRILEMLETQPATQVAAALTREGIPTPDHNRVRTDNGISHLTSGIWHSTTVVNIARHPLNLTLRPYGRRSMGDRLRFDPDGPRTLDEQDFRADGKVKVIANPAGKVIVSGAHFSSPVSPEKHQQLLTILDERGGRQRGKPRSRTPEKNPLGGRIFDCECRWPMYRVPYRESFQYVCGFYQQSNGSECNHNHVDGPVAVRFMLSTLTQNILMPDKLAKLRSRIQELAARETSSDDPREASKKNDSALARLEVDLDKAGRNLAGAETEAQRKAIGKVVDELSAQRDNLEAKKRDIEYSRHTSVDMQSEIEAALETVYHLGDMAKNVDDFTTAKNFFDTLNARLFLWFRAEPWGKRMLRKCSTGVLTVGNEPPPVVLYQGPTDRRSIKTMTATSSAAVMGGSLPPEASISQCPRPEGDSLGNLNRGDRI